MDQTKETRQYSEAALRLEAIIRTATDGIIVIDQRGIIETVNDAAARLFGYAIAELVGRNINLLMPQPHRDRHNGYIENYLHTGLRRIIGIGREVEGMRKDGTVFPFRLSISEVKLRNRRIFTGIVHDLTEQKRAENALREEKEKARMYFDLANTVNVVLDTGGLIVELNEKGCSLVGRPPEEVIGLDWFELVLKGEEKKTVRESFCRMMEGKMELVPYYENQVTDHEGNERFFAWHNNLIRNGKGLVTGMISSGTDISMRRMAEQALQKEKARAQQYLDIANTIFVVINRDGTIALLNKKGCEILGYTEEEALGKNWFDLALMKKDREKMRRIFRSLMKGKELGKSSYFENVVQTRDGGRRLIAWRNAVIKDENGLNAATISSGVDITEQQAAEENIKKLNTELEERVESRTEELAEAVNQLLHINKQLEYEIQERKLAEAALRKSEQDLRKAYETEKKLNVLKTRFVSMASHEFRTPLSTILSSADIIEAYAESAQQDRREKHTNRIKSAVANLTGILNDFLSLSRLEEGKVEPDPVEFELRDFCREIIDELQGLLKKGQRIRCGENKQDRTVFLDKKFLKNILFNLLSNAIKYSDAGSPIDLSLTVKDDYFEISVTDYGIGIPEEEQQHLFTRFFRAHNVENIQGTGLGLNIVRRYVDLMNGNISFESKQGKGTTFRVQIPLHRAPDNGRKNITEK